MVEGIIYKYTSPSGKSYIGQTTNEKHRKNTWNCLKYRYAGPKIDRARAKYGPSNFKYEVLHKKYYFNIAEATADLDKWEIYYIGYYNSFKNGYNSTIGGLTSRGAKRSDEYKRKMSQARKGQKLTKEQITKIKKSLTGSKHTLAASLSSKNKRRSSGWLDKIYQFDTNGKLIKVWSCVSEVYEQLNISFQNVYRATKTLGKYKGYYWRTTEIFTFPPVRNNSKKVYQRDLNYNIVRIHDSILQAATSLGKQPTLISRCLNGKRDSVYGFIWTFN